MKGIIKKMYCVSTTRLGTCEPTDYFYSNLTDAVKAYYKFSNADLRSVVVSFNPHSPVPENVNGELFGEFTGFDGYYGNTKIVAFHKVPQEEFDAAAEEYFNDD